MSKEKLVRIGWVVLGAIIGISVAYFFILDHGMTRSTISINDQEMEVYVAKTTDEHRQGLSNIKLEEFDVAGMLFIFEDFQQRTFWMKDMHFAIDIAWMHDDLIVKTQQNIPIPDDSGTTYMDSKPFEIDAVLELPAGGVDEYGLTVDQTIEY
ncbi:DUF192 domain-containing protein [Candidatus Uhrbacteria bacterium]|jgi:uncharacterized protein|nr:DUF192 domain-containing protein [Candidatus Uhrbacteria bacterium]MBT7717650.1 DUF192 domain-containing protein [Candidatus Uhrbacteria bacterium]